MGPHKPQRFFGCPCCSEKPQGGSRLNAALRAASLRAPAFSRLPLGDLLEEDQARVLLEGLLVREDRQSREVLNLPLRSGCLALLLQGHVEMDRILPGDCPKGHVCIIIIDQPLRNEE